MLTLIALAIVTTALIAIRASARLVVLIITLTSIIVLSTTNAHASGLGACGQCTTNYAGLSLDYLAVAIIAVFVTLAITLLVRSDKKAK